MNPQVSTITLGVEDVNRAKEFYIDGLGCPLEKDAGAFVSLGLGAGSSTLALYRREALAEDADVAADGSGFRGLTLSYIVESAERVDAMLAAAVRAGAAIVKPAKRAVWGGYSAHFADPDGYLWKVGSSSGPALVRRRPQAPPDGPVTMDAKETAVTIGVQDVKRTRQFYGEGLGLPVDKAYSRFVSFKPGNGSSTLALYRWGALADDAGVSPDGSGFRGFTLSYVVDSAEQVDTVLADASRAGGAVSKPAQDAEWGGYSGYFTDPDGYLWKVASNA